MNLLVFCPAVKSSAIGRMTSLVTGALVAARHSVTVVRTETEQLLASPSHDFGAPLVAWTDADALVRLARSADALVYAVGDSYGFHRGALEWLPKLPGLVCLHDFFLGDLFYGWAQNDLRAADAILRTWYGDESARRFFSHRTVEDFIECTRVASPMTEWLCSMAQGVITHSSWGIDRVLASCPGPVFVAPLAYDAASLSTRPAGGPARDDETFHLLTVGHVNPNKRVASVIRAIGGSPLLQKRTVYRLAGSIPPATAERLAALAARCNVRLAISGQVDDAALAQAFDEADVVSCLRWPSTEAASASAIEAMLYGKATVVTDTGFYSELPDQCVVKILPDDEIDALRLALERLLTNREARQTLGAEAQRWARATFTTEKYCEAIFRMVESDRRSRPVLAAVDAFADQLLAWGATSDLLTLEPTIAPLRLFGSTMPQHTA